MYPLASHLFPKPSSLQLWILFWAVFLNAGVVDRLLAADNNIQWNGVSHISWQDLRPLCPTGGESFEVRFQMFSTDITSARVQVDSGAVFWVNASWQANRGPYDIWAAQVPSSTASSLAYWIELTDGTDTDYYSLTGMSDVVPTDGGFVVDYVTLSHAPVGATPVTQGTVFKVWSPTRTTAHVRGDFNAWGLGNPMTKVGDHFVAHVLTAADRQQYKYFFNNLTWNTDARARDIEPGNNNNAYVENPFRYNWQVTNFVTPPLEEMVIYQLHVGTFSGLNDPFGSVPFPARYVDVQNRVAHLAALGVNAVMINPITEFPGDHSAGYNPQTQWSPESRYGTPDALKAMVDALHQNGIAVLVDIVWNHFSVTDNFMWNYDGSQLYFDSPAVNTPWGAQGDFDAGRARDYYLDSAIYWLEELHADGFRMDGTDFMPIAPQDAAGWSLMQEFNDRIDNRWVDKVTIAEQLPDDPGVTRPTASGGAGFDAQYHDAFTDQLRQEIIDAAFGDPEMWKIRNIINGSGAFMNGRSVMNYFELHDEAWPTSGGQRFVRTIDTTAPHDDIWAQGRTKLAQGLVLTAPGVPAFLQGTEWLEDANFGTDPAERIDWGHLTTYSGIFSYYQDLIALRTGNPALRADSPHTTFHLNEAGNVIGFHRFDNNGSDFVVIANFSNTDFSNYRIGLPIAGNWNEVLNSQSTTYGGSGIDNPGVIVTDPTFADGFAQSAQISLAKMGFVILQPGLPTSVSETEEALGGSLLRFDSVYPSPTRGGTTAIYRLSNNQHVRVSVHDARGRRVATLVEGSQRAGRRVVRWDGSGLDGNAMPAGIYFLKLEVGKQTATHKITLMR